MKKTKKITARETARQLTEIMMEHLSTLTPEEREKRIKAGQGVMVDPSYNASRELVASGTRATASRHSRTAPRLRAARGR